MPRFDEEGFNPKKRIDNDSRDRSVPVDEDYFNQNDFNSDDVIDNQNTTDIDLDAFMKEFDEPKRSARQSADDFVPQVYVDRDAEKRRENEERARKRRELSPPPRRKRKKSSGANKAKNIFRAIIAVILVAVIGAGCFVGNAMGKVTYDDKRKNQYVSRSDLAHSSSVTNILLLGVDARNPKDDTASRSDSMMLISIDKAHNCVKMVSFLRDTWVYIPCIDKKQRLNAACQYDGYNGVVDTIEYNFGIDIDGYVVADFEMFKVLVDSIGGVEVEVSEKEAKEVTSHKGRYGNVKLDAGKYKLTGEQALAYCRIRKIDTDFMRAYRQRTVMQAILKSVKSANPIKLVSMASKAAPYIETNLSKTKIISSGLKALPCIGDMAEVRVPFDGTWQYATIGGASVITIDVDKNKEQLKDLIYNKTAAEIKAEQNN
ncbi:LCP family protein [uncultured Eubacterium sp.]|mgnify:FL=1|uniref:LCP family protein n=1 Tax=uncultured Eubacterium sp. TaxID=165185 RepID=UPI0025ECAF16|nr:LCP family protein [uncultured Eubacterium sp.]